MTEREILIFVDADSHDFDAGFITGLLGPLLLKPGVEMVKGTFERPLAPGAAVPKGRAAG